MTTKPGTSPARLPGKQKPENSFPEISPRTPHFLSASALLLLATDSRTSQKVNMGAGLVGKAFQASVSAPALPHTPDPAEKTLPRRPPQEDWECDQIGARVLQWGQRGPRRETSFSMGRMASPTVDRKLVPSGAKPRAAAASGAQPADGKAQQRTHGSQGTSQARLTPGKAPPPTLSRPGLTCRLQPTAALSPARGTSRAAGGPRAPTAEAARPGPSACTQSSWDAFRAVLQIQEKLSKGDIRILLDDSCGGREHRQEGPDGWTDGSASRGLFTREAGCSSGHRPYPSQHSPGGRGQGHRLSPVQETTRTPNTQQRRTLGRVAQLSPCRTHPVRAHPTEGTTGEGGALGGETGRQPRCGSRVSLRSLRSC